MATLVVLRRGVPVNMSVKGIDAALEELKNLGYRVSYIFCGECDRYDLLVELHSCHLEDLNILFDEDKLDPTTDLI